MTDAEDRLFDAEWLDRAASEVDASSLHAADPLVFTVTVLGGPRKETPTTWTFRNLAVEARPGLSEGSAVDFSVPWSDCLAILSGKAEPSVAYMQGKLKMTGDMSVALQLLEWSATPEFDRWRQRVTSDA